MTVLGIDIDRREDYLEEHWRDGCRCEMVHRKSRCLVEAVAIRKTCVASYLMCEIATHKTHRQIAEDATDCSGCRQHVADCWSVIDL